MSGRLGSGAKPGHLGTGAGGQRHSHTAPSLLSMSVTPALIQDLSTWKAFCGPTVCSAGPGWVPGDSGRSPSGSPSLSVHRRLCWGQLQPPEPVDPRSPAAPALPPGPHWSRHPDPSRRGHRGVLGQTRERGSHLLNCSALGGPEQLRLPQEPGASQSVPLQVHPPGSPTSPAAWLALGCGRKPPQGPRVSYRLPLGARLPVVQCLPRSHTQGLG